MSALHVAVVIPYGGGSERRLRSAIESVQTQVGDARPLVYLIDDQPASAPGLELRLLGGDVRVLRSGGRGAPTARNLGIQAALDGGATHLALLDADDRWVSNHLVSSLGVLAASGQRAISYARLFGIRAEWETPPSGQRLRPLAFENFASTQTLVMTRQAAAELCFDPAFERLQDWDYVLRAQELDIELVYNADGGAWVTETASSISRGAGADDRLARSIVLLLLKHRDTFEGEPRAVLTLTRRAIRAAEGKPRLGIIREVASVYRSFWLRAALQPSRWMRPKRVVLWER